MLLGYNKKQVSSFNRFFGFEFRFWKKFEFNITSYYGTLIGNPTPGIQWYKFRPPGVTPNQEMGPPWGAFCQITLTSCFYGTIACDSGVLSRVLWLVGPLKLRVTIQFTLSLRSYLPTTGSSNDVVWRMFIVYISERKLTTSGILRNFNRCKWKG